LGLRTGPTLLTMKVETRGTASPHAITNIINTPILHPRYGSTKERDVSIASVAQTIPRCAVLAKKCFAVGTATERLNAV